MPEMNGNEKTITLFRYMNELCNIKSKIVRRINDQYWYKNLEDMPINKECITLNNRNTVDSVEYDGIILEVRKPNLLVCPEPDELFSAWLNPGWDNPNRPASVVDTMRLGSGKDDSFYTDETENSQNYTFDSDENRVAAFKAWKEKRDEWAEVQRERLKIRDLFTSLYKLHVTMERDTDTRELLIGNGVLTDTRDTSLFHPIVMKRVKTEFDTLDNVIRIVDTEIAPELYTMLLTNIEDFSFSVLPGFAEQLAINAYHPLDNVDTPEFLKQLLHALSPDSQYIEDPAVQRSERFQIRSSPVFFVRARRDGATKAIEAIINDIKENGNVPSHLLNLVGEGTVTVEEEISEKTLPEQLAEVGGEDVDILLTKAANKEQLEIARRISKYDAVLVQGPPGTGKTHTIANLLGHFLSQGNTVLVTSHTKKALSVVKRQVTADLQTLCVAVLDDNNSDMERSVDGITEMISRYPLHDLTAKIQDANTARKAAISKLANVRQRIYEIKNGSSVECVGG